MAMPHLAPGQVLDLGSLDPDLSDAKSIALFKSENLEVIRLVLRAGKTFPPHKVPGDITIQCLEGVISVSAEGAQSRLKSGQLTYLAGNVVHAVLAEEDASALVTIALVSTIR